MDNGVPSTVTSFPCHQTILLNYFYTEEMTTTPFSWNLKREVLINVPPRGGSTIIEVLFLLEKD